MSASQSDTDHTRLKYQGYLDTCEEDGRKDGPGHRCSVIRRRNSGVVLGKVRVYLGERPCEVDTLDDIADEVQEQCQSIEDEDCSLTLLSFGE